MAKVNTKEIFWAKLRDSAKIPTKKEEDAGFDMWACFDENFFVIEPGETKGIPTGVASAFSSDYYIQIEERSSMAKMGIKKSGGVIDSGYRGEYFIMTYNTNKVPFVISKVDFEDLPQEFEVDGKKYNKDNIKFCPYKKAICQAVPQVVPKLVGKELSYAELMKIKSERMTGGFGSSDKK